MRRWGASPDGDLPVFSCVLTAFPVQDGGHPTKHCGPPGHHAADTAIWYDSRATPIDWQFDEVVIEVIANYIKKLLSVCMTVCCVEFINPSPPTATYRIYASVNPVSVASGNGLSPVRYQAITRTNTGLLSIEPLGKISVKFESKF